LTPGARSGRAVNAAPAAAVRPEPRTAHEHTSTDVIRTIGRYALHAEIAAGGMATIHIGRLLGPVGFARTVAIKRLHPPLAKDPEFVAMFLDEARLAARIRHPNVVSTLDVVATEGELFVVMEYVPGESLARLLRVVRTNQEIVPVPIAAAIMVGVLHGLHAAHEARDERGDPLRIVHRDVSPHNILVGTDGAAHVIDFGIAKARGRMQVTRQGQIKGKLSYMPSEQLLGQSLDHRADIFAAAIVLWESLTGQRLFQGVDDGDVYAKVLLGKVDPPSLYAKGVSSELDAIVLRALSRDRNQRYASAREMALALEASVPLATASQVGRWVESLVGDALAERTEQIAGIERNNDSESDPTSSALLTFAGGAPLAASDGGTTSQGTLRSARGTTPSGSRTAVARVDRTAPTQPHGRAARAEDLNPTTVERRTQASDPPPAIVPETPRKRSRRLVAATLLLVPLGYWGLQVVRGSNAGSVSAKVPAEARSAAAIAPSAVSAPSGVSSASNGWVPASMPSSASSAASPAETPAVSSPEALLSAPKVTPRPAAPRASEPASHETTPPVTNAVTNPATTPATKPTAPNGSSCDPPFYIDADGTKRYKRYCAGL
jgi:serine/threonine-protein kinase